MRAFSEVATFLCAAGVLLMVCAEARFINSPADAPADAPAEVPADTAQGEAEMACVDIGPRFSSCFADYGYTQTSLPNAFGDTNIIFARAGARDFTDIYNNSNCASQHELQEFICVSHFPPCVGTTEYPGLKGCQPWCESLRSRCEAELTGSGLSWPSCTPTGDNCWRYVRGDGSDSGEGSPSSSNSISVESVESIESEGDSMAPGAMRDFFAMHNMPPTDDACVDDCEPTAAPDTTTAEGEAEPTEAGEGLNAREVVVKRRAVTQMQCDQEPCEVDEATDAPTTAAAAEPTESEIDMGRKQQTTVMTDPECSEPGECTADVTDAPEMERVARHVQAATAAPATTIENECLEEAEECMTEADETAPATAAPAPAPAPATTAAPAPTPAATGTVVPSAARAKRDLPLWFIQRHLRQQAAAQRFMMFHSCDSDSDECGGAMSHVVPQPTMREAVPAAAAAAAAAAGAEAVTIVANNCQNSQEGCLTTAA